MFNCAKLIKTKTGQCFGKNLMFDLSELLAMIKEIGTHEVRESVDFNGALLEEQSTDKMDLMYWVDYVH